MAASSPIHADPALGPSIADVWLALAAETMQETSVYGKLAPFPRGFSRGPTKAPSTNGARLDLEMVHDHTPCEPTQIGDG